jgi:hypothetical protein
MEPVTDLNEIFFTKFSTDANSGRCRWQEDEFQAPQLKNGVARFWRLKVGKWEGEKGGPQSFSHSKVPKNAEQDSNG